VIALSADQPLHRSVGGDSFGRSRAAGKNWKILAQFGLIYRIE
jgi:hypothetical protein